MLKDRAYAAIKGWEEKQESGLWLSAEAGSYISIIKDQQSRIEELEDAFSSLYYQADKVAKNARTDELQRCITDLTRPLYEFRSLNGNINKAVLAAQESTTKPVDAHNQEKMNDKEKE